MKPDKLHKSRPSFWEKNYYWSNVNYSSGVKRLINLRKVNGKLTTITMVF